MRGIICAGHWVLDRIKMINQWPHLLENCSILSESISNGGAPFNVLMDLANLKTDIPTYGVGCIGDDEPGKIILKICQEKNIDIEFLKILPNQPTSYTDAMTIESTGERTLFYYSGANKNFSIPDVALDKLITKNAKLFYFGHLLQMPAMDAFDAEYGCVSARLLHAVQQIGMQTVIDIVSETSNRYQTSVVPTLLYVDHFVLNEIEAYRTSGISTRHADGKVYLEGIKQAAKKLFELGVNKTVVIHMPEGGYWLDKAGNELFYPSLKIPTEKFIATCGAGDAFCSGVLVGLHEDWSIADSLRLANATAAASITSRHNSNGIESLQAVMELSERWKI